MGSYVKFASTEWPFIGLRPFEYEDHKFFFGREDELNELEPLVQKNFIAIIGGSGSGKSSLVRAGLKPRLEKAPDDPWNWISMRPAEAPIRRLAFALASLSGDTGDHLEAWADRLERVLCKSSFGMAEALAQIPAARKSQHGRILLLVDQFEELFRFANVRSESDLDEETAAERRDEATDFVRLLLTATKSPQVPIHVVVTMRSDFIGDCARFQGLPEVVSRNQFLVPGMTRDQREDVIRKPVELAGGQIDAGLVQQALNDTNDDPDQLPILQHAMMRCWERAARHSHLTIDDYTNVGGVAQALSFHANEIYKSLTVDLQLTTKRVFQTLTETDQQGRSVRRPQLFRVLTQYVRAGDVSETDSTVENATATVIRRFASPDRSFLRVIRPADSDDSIVVDTESDIDVDPESIIDIGHEALIRRWDMLHGEGEKNWMREEQDDAERYRALLRYATEGLTIPPEDLTALEPWWYKRKPNPFWAQRYTKSQQDKFKQVYENLIHSRAKADAAIEESKKYETRVIAIVANAILLPRVLSGAADSLAMALNKPASLPNVTRYVELLYAALGELREKRRIWIPNNFEKQIFALRFAPAGNLLAVAVPGNLLFYDADSGKLVHSEATQGGWVMSLRWSPDGKRIYVGTSPRARILAACSMEKLRKYFTESGDNESKASVTIGTEEHPGGAGAWSRDGKWIIVAAWQRPAGVWDASTGEIKRILCDDSLKENPLDCLFSDVVASADGERIAVGAASGKIHIFNLNTDSVGEEGPSLELHGSLDSFEKDINPLPYSLAFDPQDHNRLLVAYMPSPYVVLWEIDKRTRSVFQDEGSGFVWRVGFDPGGEFVVSAANDGAVRLWMGTDSKNAVQLRGHLGSVLAVDVSTKNGYIASGSVDGTIRIWTKDSPLSASLPPTSASMAPGNAFSIQDSHITLKGSDGKTHSARLPEKFGEISAAAVSANGRGIAIIPRSFGQPVLLVNLTDPLITVSVPLCGVEAEWVAVAFTENDTRVVARTREGKTFAWPFYSDVQSLEQLAKERLPLVSDDSGVDKRLAVPPFILRSSSDNLRHGG
jgi:WD40 repeat protein